MHFTYHCDKDNLRLWLTSCVHVACEACVIKKQNLVCLPQEQECLCWFFFSFFLATMNFVVLDGIIYWQCQDRLLFYLETHLLFIQISYFYLGCNLHWQLSERFMMNDVIALFWFLLYVITIHSRQANNGFCLILIFILKFAIYELHV